MATTAKKRAPKAKDSMEKSIEGLRDLLANKDFDNIPEVAKLRERLDSGLNEIEDSALDMLEEAKQKTKKAAKVADEFVRNEPWPILGAAVVLGAVIGFAASRR